MELTVIMPCHNEGAIIRRNLGKVVSTLEGSGGGSFEIIAIDDGSVDGTFEEMQWCASRYGNIKCVRMYKNRGKGHALRTGFRFADGELISFLDGDLDLHPDHIPMFLKEMERTGAHVVIGSKRHPDSKVNYPTNRRALSKMYQRFLRTFFSLDIRDSQVGLKLFKREVLSEIMPRLLVKRYAFDIELLVNAHRKGYRIVEAPIEMDFINAVGSDVNMRAVGRMLVDTCAVFYRLNIVRHYDGLEPLIDERPVGSEFIYLGLDSTSPLTVPTRPD